MGSKKIKILKSLNMGNTFLLKKKTIKEKIDRSDYKNPIKQHKQNQKVNQTRYGGSHL